MMKEKKISLLSMDNSNAQYDNTQRTKRRVSLMTIIVSTRETCRIKWLVIYAQYN